jgi:hypothetical protein
MARQRLSGDDNTDETTKVKEIKIVKEPKISLKPFSKYPFSTARGKNRIIESSKYPGDYFPKYYEIARKIICDTFSGNFPDHSLYFEEFSYRSAILKKEAIEHLPKTDKYKNRIFSSEALDTIIKMAPQLNPILDRYILNSNLLNKKDGITVQGVRIGSMSDILLSENGGASLPIGFIKFYFAKDELKKEQADVMLHVLRSFFEQKKGLSFEFRNCILIDVFSDKLSLNETVKNACIEIKTKWDAI